MLTYEQSYSTSHSLALRALVAATPAPFPPNTNSHVTTSDMCTTPSSIFGANTTKVKLLLNTFNSRKTSITIVYSLGEWLSNSTTYKHTAPIRDKDITFNFYDQFLNFVGIFIPKFTAILKHLKIIATLLQFPDAPYDQRRAYKKLVNKLTYHLTVLSECAPTTPPYKWQRLEFDCRAF